jgi:hypothetical protein
VNKREARDVVSSHEQDERGWNQVDHRLTWASKANSDGSHDNDEVLTTIRGTDLALVTQLEHITNRNPDGSVRLVQHPALDDILLG